LCSSGAGEPGGGGVVTSAAMRKNGALPPRVHHASSCFGANDADWLRLVVELMGN
jgi:hypothetical protein